MTDFADACFGCGGHLRRNVYSGTLCPECELRQARGEIDAFGRPCWKCRAPLNDEGTCDDCQRYLARHNERALRFLVDKQRRDAA